MKKKTMTTTHKSDKVKYRYEIHKAENVRIIRMSTDDGFDGSGECEIVIAKHDWYYLAFPDMGTASPAFADLSSYERVSDLVHDAGFYHPDTEAITLAILEVAKSGF